MWRPVFNELIHSEENLRQSASDLGSELSNNSSDIEGYLVTYVFQSLLKSAILFPEESIELLIVLNIIL